MTFIKIMSQIKQLWVRRELNQIMQGRRRVLKSGTAIERPPECQRHEWGEHERGSTPSSKGGSGGVPREKF